MQDHDWLAERFEANRTDLRAVASRVLVQRERAGPTLGRPVR